VHTGEYFLSRYILDDITTAEPDFHHLTPEVVISLVEGALGCRLRPICRSLNSYINRVYELQRDDGVGLVAKFYRPGRWDFCALEDEHNFMRELSEAEIPVVAPLEMVFGGTLGEYKNTLFTVFPKKGGRTPDEFNHKQWLELGRLVGRTHAIGAGSVAHNRINMSPITSTYDQLQFLLNGNFISDDLISEFDDLFCHIIDVIAPVFEGLEQIRIHGDLHFANIIHRLDEGYFLIDFDDMCMGHPVQDFWMLLPGYQDETQAEIESFLQGYETFRNFDMRGLRLIEPLRIMRYIHYCCWCAHQVADGGFNRIAPGWGTRSYWRSEINDLQTQLNRIKNNLI